MLKAHLECRKANYRKAVRLLSHAKEAVGGVYSPGSRSEAFSRAVHLQNLGCTLFRMGRFAASALHFSKALDVCERYKDMEASRVWPALSGLPHKLTGDNNTGVGLSLGLPSPYHTVRAQAAIVMCGSA